MNGLSGSAEDESLRWSLSFEPNDVTHPYSLLWHSTEANENVGFKVNGLWDFKLYLLRTHCFIGVRIINFVDLSPLKQTTSPIHIRYCGTAQKRTRMSALKLMGYGVLSYID